MTCMFMVKTHVYVIIWFAQNSFVVITIDDTDKCFESIKCELIKLSLISYFYIGQGVSYWILNNNLTYKDYKDDYYY